MTNRERRLRLLVIAPLLLTAGTIAAARLLSRSFGVETALMTFTLYASLVAALRAVVLTIRAQDVGELESERLTIALALVASIVFLLWRLWAVLVVVWAASP